MAVAMRCRSVSKPGVIEYCLRSPMSTQTGLVLTGWPGPTPCGIEGLDGGKSKLMGLRILRCGCLMSGVASVCCPARPGRGRD